MLDAGSGLRGSPWLAVADATRAPGERAARIRLAAVLDEAGAREVGAALLVTVAEAAWSDGDVRAEEREMLGAVVLGATGAEDQHEGGDEGQDTCGGVRHV